MAVRTVIRAGVVANRGVPQGAAAAGHGRGSDNSAPVNVTPTVEGVGPSAGNPSPSLYLTQNVPTPQGNVGVQFIRQQPVNGVVSYKPVGISTNQTFTVPINQSSNGFNITGNATYAYQLANSQLVPVQTGGTTQVTYNGISIATGSGASLAVTQNQVAQPIYGNVSGTNQLVGTLEYTPTVSNGTVSLQYASFVPATVTVAGSYQVSTGGRSYKVGYSYPETTSYNPSTGQVAFTPTALFPGGNPLPTTSLFIGNANLIQVPVTIGSQAQGTGISVAYNVTTSPFTQPVSQTIGLVDTAKGGTPSSTITTLTSSGPLVSSNTYTLQPSGAISDQTTLTSFVPATVTVAGSYQNPTLTGFGPWSSSNTYMLQPGGSYQNTIITQAIPLNNAAVAGSLQNAILPQGLTFGNATTVSPFSAKSFNIASIPPASAFVPNTGSVFGVGTAPGIIAGGSPLDTIVQTIGTQGRYYINLYQTNVIGSVQTFFSNAPPINITTGGFGLNSQTPSVIPVSQITENIVVGALGVASGTLTMVFDAPKAGASLADLPSQFLKSPAQTIDQFIGSALVFGLVDAGAGTVSESIDEATYGEAPPRPLPKGTTITNLVVRVNPVDTGETGTIDVLPPTSTSYDILTDLGAKPMTNAEVVIGQTSGYGVTATESGPGFTVTIGNGDIGYNISAYTEATSVAYDNALSAVSGRLYPIGTQGLTLPDPDSHNLPNILCAIPILRHSQHQYSRT